MTPPLYPISGFQSQCPSLRHAGGNACAFRYGAGRRPRAELHLQPGRALPGHPRFRARPQLLTGLSSTPSCLSSPLGVLLQRRSDAVRSMLAAGSCAARYTEGGLGVLPAGARVWFTDSYRRRKATWIPDRDCAWNPSTMPGGEFGATGRPRGTAVRFKGDAEQEAHEAWQDAACFMRRGEGNAFMDDSLRSLAAVKGGDVP